MRFILRCIPVLLAGVLLISTHRLVAQTGNNTLADELSVSLQVEIPNVIHVGEPFEYRLRVLYRPDRVEPDFAGLLRNVRFVPFEQLHLRRPVITRTTLADGMNEYILSYPVLGIAVVPYKTYTLDPVRLDWRVIASGEQGGVEVQPGAIAISGYYPAEVYGQTFEQLRPAINDYYRLKQLAIAALALLMLFGGGMLLHRALRRRQLIVAVEADRIYRQFESVSPAANPRARLLAYEQVLLTLLLFYRKFSARTFWAGRSDNVESAMQTLLLRMKQRLHPAYQLAEPGQDSVSLVREDLQQVFTAIQPDIDAERQAGLDALQGTLSRRIRQHQLSFAGGISAVLVGLCCAVLLLRPAVWREADIILYNDWINGLPARIFDNSRDRELGVIDVQMLVQFAEQQDILQKLQTDIVKSAYLYNFGTVVARAYVSILSGENQDAEQADEEESTNKPSFEFPLQLLANAVRLYPQSEDGRRNLELAIVLREAEKKEEDNGQVQGEVGPPLPGFSRDMKQILF
jgi:hypothetical protein